MKQPRSDLAECLTTEEIGILAQCYGAGQRLYVPSSTANARHLEVLLGLVATSRLVHALGGNYVYLPGLKRPDGHPREPSLTLVKRLSAPGPNRMSAIAIARKHHVSVRSVYGKKAEIKRRERLGMPLEGKGRARQPVEKARSTKKRARDHRSSNRVSLRRSALEHGTDD